PMGQQRHHQAHGLCRGPQTIEGCAFCGAERLAARRTEKALLLARVDANVALAGLSSGGARPIGAECCRGVHACLLRVTLGNVRRGVCLAPHFHCKRTVPRFSVELPPFARRVVMGVWTHRLRLRDFLSRKLTFSSLPPVDSHLYSQHLPSSDNLG